MNQISSISEVQEAIAGVLSANTFFSTHDVPILVENSKDIEYQIKSSMTALGIAATVATPSLTYGGDLHTEEQNNLSSTFPYWTVNSGSVVIVENPTLNRGKNNYATALDTALQTALTLQQIPNICDSSIVQTTQGGLVVVTVQFKTNLTFALTPTS